MMTMWLILSLTVGWVMDTLYALAGAIRPGWGDRLMPALTWNGWLETCDGFGQTDVVMLLGLWFLGVSLIIIAWTLWEDQCLECDSQLWTLEDTRCRKMIRDTRCMHRRGHEGVCVGGLEPAVAPEFPVCGHPREGGPERCMLKAPHAGKHEAWSYGWQFGDPWRKEWANHSMAARELGRRCGAVKDGLRCVKPEGHARKEGPLHADGQGVCWPVDAANEPMGRQVVVRTSMVLKICGELHPLRPNVDCTLRSGHEGNRHVSEDKFTHRVVGWDVDWHRWMWRCKERKAHNYINRHIAKKLGVKPKIRKRA